VDVLATLFCAFGWVASGAGEICDPADLASNLLTNGRTDIVTAVI
jgi:hypothetical protein